MQKEYTYLVHYYNDEKEIREPVPAYNGEAIESHTRICREEFEGTTIAVELLQQEERAKARELSAKDDIAGTLDDLFTIYPDAEYRYVESVLSIY